MLLPQVSPFYMSSVMVRIFAYTSNTVLTSAMKYTHKNIVAINLVIVLRQEKTTPLNISSMT